jgi:hypothetical protein
MASLRPYSATTPHRTRTLRGHFTPPARPVVGRLSLALLTHAPRFDIGLGRSSTGNQGCTPLKKANLPINGLGGRASSSIKPRVDYPRRERAGVGALDLYLLLPILPPNSDCTDVMRANKNEERKKTAMLMSKRRRFPCVGMRNAAAELG